MELKISRSTIEALRDVTHAASTDDMRPVLCAVELTVTTDELQAQATDSYILARRSAPIEAPEVLTVLLPAKALRDATTAALKDRITLEFRVELTEAGLTIHFGTGSASVQTTEGRFPNVDQLLAGFKADSLEDLIFSPWRLEQAARALGVEKPKRTYGGDRSHAVWVTFQGANKLFKVIKASELDPAGNFAAIMPVR